MKRSWKEYNASLVRRGSITFWIEECLLHRSSHFEKTRGRPRFLRSLIQAGWVLKVTFKLTYRSLEGYMNSLFALARVQGVAPHYSLFCKRGKEIEGELQKLSKRKPMEIVIDSSGLKIYGEGEWKEHKHGRDKKKEWVKIHAAVDPKTGECVAVEVTDEKGADGKELPKLVKKSPKSVKRVYADGAYDTLRCRRALKNRGIEECIPPRKTAILRKEPELEARNEAIREIRGLDGDLALWKKLKGYGRRSLVETFFSRLKILLGERLKSRSTKNQRVECLMQIYVLNRMLNSVSFV